MTTTVAILEWPSPLGREDRKLLLPQERLPIRAWAEEHLRVVDGPLAAPTASGGAPWSPRAFPLQQAVMDAIEDPRWQSVCVMAPPQAFGKTQCAAIPPLLHAIAHRRVDAIYVAGNQDLANQQWKKKVRPIMEASPELRDLLHDQTDRGGNRLYRTFTNGTGLHFVGAESVGNLSGHTLPVVICDDVQAYPEMLPRFGHPADYAITRAGSFPPELRTIVVMGTAGTAEDWLWRTLCQSTFYVPFVPCPACWSYQILSYERLTYDPQDPLADTWMRCAHPTCLHRIRFDELITMLDEHRWVSMPPDAQWIAPGNAAEPPAPSGGAWTSEPPAPSRGSRTEAEDPPLGAGGSDARAGGAGGSEVVIDIDDADVYPATSRVTWIAGFWSNDLYWPWGKTWAERAADLVDRTGQPDRMKDHWQNCRNLVWVEPLGDGDRLREADVLAHALEGHKWGTVPAIAAANRYVALTADVQAGHLWYLVEAWDKSSGASWLIELGRYGARIDPADVPDREERRGVWRTQVARAMEALWKKASAGWAVESGGRAVPDICLIDCSFLREVVQTSCRRFNGGSWLGVWRPCEGSQAPARSRVPVWPGKPKIESRTRYRYWESNLNRAKLYLRQILAIPPGEPGSLTLPGDMPDQCREWFAKHLCAEEWDGVRGRWNLVSDANHLLDCAAMQIAAAIAGDVQLELTAQEAGATTPKTERMSAKEWFGRGKRKG